MPFPTYMYWNKFYQLRCILFLVLWSPSSLVYLAYGLQSCIWLLGMWSIIFIPNGSRVFMRAGEDISVCVCLAILLTCFDSNGKRLLYHPLLFFRILLFV